MHTGFKKLRINYIFKLRQDYVTKITLELRICVRKIRNKTMQMGRKKFVIVT